MAILIALGALLTFKVMGEEYSRWTVVGFIATVFFAFVVVLPAETLFGSRAEFAKGSVEIVADETSPASPVPSDEWVSSHDRLGRNRP